MNEQDTSIINDASPFEQLKNIFQIFLGPANNTHSSNEYDPAIPQPMREVYALYDNLPASKYKEKLFIQQDRLIFPEHLDLTATPFEFIEENSGNWYLFVNRGDDNSQVYINNFEGESTKELFPVTVPLTELLITYTLQELTFSLDEISYGYWWTIDKLGQKFSSIKPIWINKSYEYNDSSYSFYLLDDDFIYMEAMGDIFITTINPDKAELLNFLEHPK